MMLVTGAGGFIGSQVCRLLSTRGYAVEPSTSVLPPVSLIPGSLATLAALIFSLK